MRVDLATILTVPLKKIYKQAYNYISYLQLQFISKELDR